MAIEVKGRVSLDGNPWEAGIRKIEGATNNFANNTLGSLKGKLAAAFTIGTLALFVKSIADVTGKLKDFSEQFDTTLRETQELEHSAIDAGLGLDDMGSALLRLGAARKAAGEGNKELQDTFARFGISMQSIQNPTKRNVDLLRQLASAIKDVTLNAGSRSALNELLGRSGERFVTALQDFAKPNANSGKGFFTDEDVKRVDDMAKAVERLSHNLKVAAAPAVAEVADSLSSYFEKTQILGRANSLADYARSKGQKDVAEFAERVGDLIVSKQAEKMDQATWQGMVQRLNDEISKIPPGTVRQSDGTYSQRPAVATDTGKMHGPFSPSETIQNPLFQDLGAQAEHDKVKAIREQIEALKTEMLPISEKLAALDLQRKRAYYEMLEAVDGSSEQLRAQLGMLKLEKEIKQVSEKNEKSLVSIPNDAFVRVGNFLGASGQSSVVAVQKGQVQWLRQIADNTKPRSNPPQGYGEGSLSNNIP